MNIEFPKNLNMGLSPELKNSKNTLFEVALLAVVCALFTWFVILPKKAEVDAKAVELTKSNEQKDNIKGDLDTLTKLISDLKAHSADVSKLDDAIPLVGKTGNLQLLLGSLASAAGVTVNDINVTGNTTGIAAGDIPVLTKPFDQTRSLQKLDASVYVTGSFGQLEDFLKKVETSGRLLQVRALEISPAQQTDLGLKITLDAYYFAPTAP